MDPSDHPPIRLSDVDGSAVTRWKTGLAEFDFVLGGGIVPGSVTLVGGEPGIGKSTLLMQCAARLESQGVATLYVSGEESPDQLRLRADRLQENAGAIHVLGETRLESIIHHAAQLKSSVVLLDSIQTTYTDELEGAPGNVGQVRECAARLMRFAKESGPAVLLVGHVTKGGGIAGPKTLEHIVDTVLYFEGETTLDHRILRAVKNRFGSVDEIGVFQMTGAGLEPVANPAAAFLAGRTTGGGASGSAVTALMEGTRPMLVEIQALASKAGFGTPQRVATGLDHRRLALLLRSARAPWRTPVRQSGRLRERDGRRSADRAFDRSCRRGRPVSPPSTTDRSPRTRRSSARLAWAARSVPSPASSGVLPRPRARAFAACSCRTDRRGQKELESDRAGGNR